MTLKRVAEDLNLSITTVSRALNGYPDVSESTREKVREAAQRVGYVPNRLAQALQRGTAEAVGIILPSQFGHFEDPFFLELLVGVGERLHNANLDLVVCAVPEGPAELDAYKRLVEGRRADAVIIARTRRHDERIDYLIGRGIPFVAHGRAETATPIAFIDADARTAFRRSTRRLIELGHRHIALIGAPEELFTAGERRAGYEDALQEAGIAFDPDLYAVTKLNERGGTTAAERLLGAARPPTALLCANDSIALGALRIARRLGIAVPEELSIVGFDDLPMAAQAEPALTTMRQDIRGAGARLADMVCARLGGAAIADLQELLEAPLIERESSGPAP